MSYEITTKESFKIKVTDEKTRAILNKIIEKFRCLNRGDGISSGEISFVRLTVNEQSVTKKYDWKREFWKTPIFHEESEIMQLLNTKEITALELLLEYTATLHGCSYGYDFMEELCKESDKSTLSNLEYKVLEYYDTDTDFTACMLCNGELVTIEPNADIAYITGVKRWFSADFQLGVSADDDLDEEVAKKARQLAAEFGEKYNLDDSDFVFWEEAIFFSNGFGIDHVSISELIKYIDKFACFALEHGLHLVLDGVFTPSDDTPEFAYMYFESGENGVETVSAKY